MIRVLPVSPESPQCPQEPPEVVPFDGVGVLEEVPTVLERLFRVLKEIQVIL